jgi:hypothetical protein
MHVSTALIRSCARESCTCALEVEILLEVIETSQGNGISVKIVEPVHAPKHGLHM